MRKKFQIQLSQTFLWLPERKIEYIYTPNGNNKNKGLTARNPFPFSWLSGEEDCTGIVALFLFSKKFCMNPSCEPFGLLCKGWVDRTPRVVRVVPNLSAERLFPPEAGVPNLYRLPEIVRTVDFSFSPFLFLKGLVSTLSPLPAITPFIRPSGKSFQESITSSPLPLLEGKVEANRHVSWLLHPS